MIVAVSEGIRDKNGDYITASKAVADQFGHQQLSGAGKALEFLVKGKHRRQSPFHRNQCIAALCLPSGICYRSVRGICTRRTCCFLLAEEGVTASMVTLTRTSNTPYAVAYDHAPDPRHCQ